jgi:transcriptional regulator GlxA family with amidase domain
VLATDFGIKQMVFCALTLHRILAWLFFRNPAFPANAIAIPYSINKALAFMNDRLHERLALTELAEHVGLSVSHFSQLFKVHIGFSPIDYFINLKIQYACHLLETTTRAIRDIANALGYEDAYYFSRLFRKLMGTSPANYRKRVTRRP